MGDSPSAAGKCRLFGHQVKLKPFSPHCFHMCESIFDPESLSADCEYPEEMSRAWMASYIAGTCSPIGKQIMDIHFLSCARCLCVLLNILPLLVLPATQGGELLALGREASSIARWSQKWKPVDDLGDVTVAPPVNGHGFAD